MTANYYKFVDRFVVPCTKETAYQYISRIEAYPRWWGRVYKKVRKLKAGDYEGRGDQYAVTIGGFLPYYLRLQTEITLANEPDQIEFIVTGDLKGKGLWLFRKAVGGTEIIFDWRVQANKPFLRLFSFLLKPLFRANHRYCIEKANEGIRKDLLLHSQRLTSI